MPTDFRVVRIQIQPTFLNWGQQLSDLPELWRESRGTGVRVAVIDSGIALHHPDLAHAIVATRDFTGSPSGIADDHGHGTHVAGIVAAKDDGQGVVGVAPEAELLVAKVIRAPGFPILKEGTADAIRWAVDEGARVICLSLTWPEPVPAVEQALEAAAAAQPPVLVVCAAGNRSQGANTVQYPAAYPTTLGIGSIRPGPGGLPTLTPDSVSGAAVDVVAPGVDVLSTYPPSAYALASGTSMAAPFVAGALALLVEHRRRHGQGDADLAKVRTLLRRTSRDLAGPGRDMLTGWGLIDPRKLVQTSG